MYLQNNNKGSAASLDLHLFPSRIRSREAAGLSDSSCGVVSERSSEEQGKLCLQLQNRPLLACNWRRGAAPPRDSSRVSLVVLEEDPKSLLHTCPIRVPLTATNIYATHRILVSSLTQRAAHGSVACRDKDVMVFLPSSSRANL